MSREYRVLWAGRHRRDEWEGLCARYRKRIEGFRPVRDVPVRVPAKGEDTTRIDKEGKALLAALPEPCWSIALDRRGRTMSSREFATRLGRLNEDWPHPVAFVIGSDLGLSQEVLSSCREALSFGPMTLPHELARLLLYEQLYRALSILSGIKYHREPL